MGDIGQSILDELYPPPPPAYVTSPIAFGEVVHARPPGAPPVWGRAAHIEVMEEAIVRTIAKRNGRLAIAVSVRHGKQLRVDEPVLTTSGWSTMGQLRVGDHVFGPAGDPRAVLVVGPVDQAAPKLRVSFTDGTHLDVHPEHEWTLTVGGRTNVFETQELARRVLGDESLGQWRYKLPNRLPLQAGVADLPVPPYSFGVWLGDGKSSGSTLSLNPQDQAEIMARINGEGVEVSSSWVQPETDVQYHYTSMLAGLRLAGVVGDKHIPDVYMVASVDQRRALLQGLVDTDGHVEVGSGRVRYVGHNERLVRDVCTLARTLGHRSTVYIEEDSREPHDVTFRDGSTHKVKTAGTRFVASWTPHDGLPQGHLTRKQVIRDRKPDRVAVRSITEAPAADGLCIQVDAADGLYLAGRDLIPTHNSMFGSRIVPAWYLGNNPDKRVMLAGHEADFASRHGRATRDLLTEHGHPLFGVKVSQASSAANRWDIEGREGGMLTLGVGGSPIGRGGDLMIVDDPYRNFADAMNPRVRKEVMSWWSGTMVSRIEPGGSVIIIMARWHTDDLIGVLTRESPEMWEVVNMPALCTDPDTDPLHRELGAPLWPERYDVEDIEVAKQGMVAEFGEAAFQAQFQQDPKAADGDIFDPDAWTYYTEPPKCDRLCRGWDFAASEGKGDWTVGVLLGRIVGTERYAILDVIRGRLSPDKVRSTVLKTAHRDRDRYGVVQIDLPQDPAQAGKDQAQQYVRMLNGFNVRTTPTTTSKVLKASGAAAQQRVGSIMLPADRRALIEGGGKGESVTWVGPLIYELEQFDNGDHDDQVDALASAYNRLAQGGTRVLV